MAFLDATLWNDLQASDAVNEKYFTPKGLLDATKDSTAFIDYLPPTARERLATISSQRLYQFPAIKDQQVTVVTTPGFANIPSNLPESANYNYVAYDVFSGFRHYPAIHENNQIDSDWQREQVMINVAHQMADNVETILAARFEERKTQVLNFTTQVSQGPGTYTFNTTEDELRVSKAAQTETMFFYLNELMGSNDVGGNYRLVSSRAGLAVQKAEARKYGPDNQQNLQALGFLPDDRIYQTNTISASTDVFNGWFFRDGGMGIYENFPFDFRNGTEIGGRRWRISDVELPFLRMRCNIYTNTQATDATALVSSSVNTTPDSNLIMTHFEEMAIWCRFYVAYRYNSSLSTRVNDVVKIKGLTT